MRTGPASSEGRRILPLLLMIVILLSNSQIVPIATGSQGQNRSAGSDSSLPAGSVMLENSTVAPRGYDDIGKVSLITGDQVRVYLAANGSLKATVFAAVPSAREKFWTFNAGNDMFVLPSEASLARFDLSLFNLRLLINASEMNGGRLGVIFQGANRHSTSHLSTYLQTKGTRVVQIQKSLHLTAAKLRATNPKQMHSTFVRLPAFTRAWLDRSVKVEGGFSWTGDSNMHIVGAPFAWSHSFNGTGARIAIVDTGIDETHPDFFFPNGTSKVITSVDFSDDGTTQDLFGHGTHVASTAAGTGAASNGTYTGVAPGADLMNVKVLDRFGFALESWVISGVQYAVVHKATVISMSLGGAPTDGSDPLSQTVDWAVQQGVGVVAAAGNYGCFECVATPGASTGAITVGAVEKSSDSLAPFSSMGPTIDGRVKPDLTAPGVNIVGARANGSLLSVFLPPVDPAGKYMELSGTSMATPHVSGAYALLIQKYPSFTPDQMKNILVSTAVDNSSLNVFQEGGGELNITAALTAQAIISPAELNLKAFGGMNQGVISVKNVGASTLTLGLSLISIDAYDHSPAPSALSLNTTSITVGPGLTGGVLVTGKVNITSALISGKILMTDSNGRTYKAIVGLDNKRPLVVRKTDFFGNPVVFPGSDPFSALVFLFKLNPSSFLDARNSLQDGIINSSGSVTFYLSPGVYELLSFSNVGGFGLLNFVDSAKIPGTSAVMFDDRNAGLVSFDSGFDKIKYAATSLSLHTSNKTILNIYIDFGAPGLDSVYLGPTNIFHGGFAYAYLHSGSPFGSARTYFYDLFFSTPTIAHGCCSWVADYSNTVQKQTKYRTQATSAVAGEVGLWGVGKYSYQDVAFGYGIRPPRTNVEVLSANIAYETVYEYVSGNSFFAQFGVFPPHAPGPVTDDWGTSPLTPSANAAFTSVGGHTNTSIDVAFYSDHSASDRLRLNLGPSEYRLYRGGVLVNSSSSLCCIEEYNKSLTDQPSGTYDLRGSAGSFSDTLSVYNFIDYQFIVSPSGDVTKGPQTGAFTVGGMDLNDTVHGASSVVTFTMNNQSALSSVNASYSYNDGGSWQRANLTTGPSGYMMKVPSTLSGPVSLMVNSSDANGLRGGMIVLEAFDFTALVTVECQRSSVMVLSSVRCTAFVTGISPGGTVTWTGIGGGRMSSATCTLQASRCAIRYTPTTKGMGGVVATYSGDRRNPPASGGRLLNVVPKRSHAYLKCALIANPSILALTCRVRVAGLHPTGSVNVFEQITAPGESGAEWVQGATLVSGALVITMSISPGPLHGSVVRVHASVTYLGDALNGMSSAVVNLKVVS